MRLLLCLLLSFLYASTLSEKARFDHYRVHRLQLTTDDQWKALLSTTLPGGLLLWGVFKDRGHVDILVPPHQRAVFDDLVQGLNITNYLMVENLQSLIDEQEPPENSTVFGWTSYQPLSQINNWLDSQAKEYPNVVTTLIGGRSFEEREIRGIKISYKSGNRGVFLEGGIHGREWISPATVTYIVNQLLRSNDKSVREIAENYDWYIFPVVNPDGYEYTFTTDRTWRKNRAPSSQTCYGTDLNRNWDSYWNETGTSSDPCTNKYPGPSAFSEVESRTLSQYISSISHQLHVYLSFHSPGQMIMFPYGYTKIMAPNHDQLMGIAKKAAKEIKKRYGTQYKYGPISKVIYPASGDSLDWVYDKLRINTSIVFELREHEPYSFLLPSEEIIPAAEETLDAVVSILQDAREIPR
ncbi:zinc carboxypeptidase [Anabrus simplex]|uniref:zinc carboxypeptidase n=1 Tax=Anabrus simplex TaxID=316456 RepID=UPI0035A38FAD